MLCARTPTLIGQHRLVLKRHATPLQVKQNSKAASAARSRRWQCAAAACTAGHFNARGGSESKQRLHPHTPHAWRVQTGRQNAAWPASRRTCGSTVYTFSTQFARCLFRPQEQQQHELPSLHRALMQIGAPGWLRHAWLLRCAAPRRGGGGGLAAALSFMCCNLLVHLTGCTQPSKQVAPNLPKRHRLPRSNQKPCLPSPSNTRPASAAAQSAAVIVRQLESRAAAIAPATAAGANELGPNSATGAPACPCSNAEARSGVSSPGESSRYRAGWG